MTEPKSTRQLRDADAKALPPGSDHYTAYVGPPEQYDLMGATQFRLLTTLGLREHHRVLDFGCGSLRAGRLLIPYLGRGNYHGLEPNQWLIEDGIRNHVGRDLVALKWPHFHTFNDFRADRCGSGFDFIVAQSIFSHAGADVLRTALEGFGKALAPTGLVLATILHPGQDGVAEYHGNGWIYPDCVAHAPETLLRFAAAAGLHGRALPWWHPRQTWYVLTPDPARLPPREFDPRLRGAILNEPAWGPSVSPSPGSIR